MIFLGHDILVLRRPERESWSIFFWPGKFNDKKQYCRSCQKETSNTQVSQVPIVQIIRIDAPFQRIAIDMVVPLPRTKRGNHYALVNCDNATKYLEAIPFKSQEAEVVAEAMVEVVSRLGVPKEILSDKGTNFMSSL